MTDYNKWSKFDVDAAIEEQVLMDEREAQSAKKEKVLKNQSETAKISLANVKRDAEIAQSKVLSNLNEYLIPSKIYIYI
jgi:hypothetical protein